MEGNTALGASSPAKPAFTRPEPLSHTRAVVSSSSHILMDTAQRHTEMGFHFYMPQIPAQLTPVTWAMPVNIQPAQICEEFYNNFSASIGLAKQ